MLGTLLADAHWLQALSESQPKALELLSRSPEEQKQRGYFHTLHEICQQPATWLNTAERMISAAPELRAGDTVRVMVNGHFTLRGSFQIH